jgi:hypothetical protein
MRVLHQSCGDVADERAERIPARPGTFSRPAVTIEVFTDRLRSNLVWRAIAEIDQFAQAMDFHVVLPCEHEKADLLQRSNWHQTQAASKEAPFSAEPHGWGISMSVSGEFQRARSAAQRR